MQDFPQRLVKYRKSMACFALLSKTNLLLKSPAEQGRLQRLFGPWAGRIKRARNRHQGGGVCGRAVDKAQGSLESIKCLTRLELSMALSALGPH